MLFVAIGVLVGPLVLDDITTPPTSSTVQTLANATLAVVLFTDSSRIDVRQLRRQAAIPLRLLGIGLPLTLALGALLAAVVFKNLAISEALILSVCLAPTDAGLGQAVVTDERLPLRVRQSLNVESGLNDGICVPVLLIAIAAAEMQPGHHGAMVVFEEIGYGLIGGIIAGVVAAGVVRVAGRKGLIAASWLQIVPVAAAALAYGVAAALGGSGLIAAFIAGLLFGTLLRGGSAQTVYFAEQAGDLLDGLTFLFFGAVLLGPALEHLTWTIVLYALLSLTVVRMLPVMLALWGTKLRAPTVALIAWFGPRGLASIVFAVLVEHSAISNSAPILVTIYLTVALSVLLHGATAAPLVSRYARWYKRHPRPTEEAAPSAEFDVRGPRVLRPSAQR
jgi:NhaP-type Na+/H+ or K+/H+ antiporter